MASPTLPTQVRRSPRRRPSWSLPAGVLSALGHRDGFGLCWLLGVERPSDALATVLRRALSVEEDR